MEFTVLVDFHVIREVRMVAKNSDEALRKVIKETENSEFSLQENDKVTFEINMP